MKPLAILAFAALFFGSFQPVQATEPDELVLDRVCQTAEGRFASYAPSRRPIQGSAKSEKAGEPRSVLQSAPKVPTFGEDPLLVDARETADALELPTYWPVKNVPFKACFAAPVGGGEEAVKIRLKSYFVFESAAESGETLEQMIANHDAIPLTLNVLCTRSTDGAAGENPCLRMRILDTIVPVDPHP